MHVAHCFHHCIHYKAKICFLLISLAFQRKQIYYITTIKKYLTLNLYILVDIIPTKHNLTKHILAIFETPFLNQACD